MVASMLPAERLLCRVGFIGIGCVDLREQFSILLMENQTFQSQYEQAAARNLQLARPLLGLFKERLVNGDSGLDVGHKLYDRPAGHHLAAFRLKRAAYLAMREQERLDTQYDSA